jgi:hypothetical protein
VADGELAACDDLCASSTATAMAAAATITTAATALTTRLSGNP